MALTEKDVTRQIRDVLKLCRVFHWKNWSGPMTSPKGISDILGIYQGRFLAIEIKRPGGKPTKEQLEFIQRVTDDGGIGFWADSVDEVVKRLNLQVKLTPMFPREV